MAVVLKVGFDILRYLRLCYAMLCYATYMLCSSMLFWAALIKAKLYYFVPGCAWLCYTFIVLYV